MLRKHLLSDTGIYHLYNRGVDRRNIFEDNEDYSRFLSLMFLCNGSNTVQRGMVSSGDTTFYDRGENLVEIYAYCLMPNHFHFLLRQRGDNGVSKLMKKILTGYAVYKYERRGSLFEGPYKSSHIENDRYFGYLVHYIHLNPLVLSTKKDNKDFARQIVEYPYSSYGAYALGLENELLSKETIPVDVCEIKSAEQMISIWRQAKEVRKELEK